MVKAFESGDQVTFARTRGSRFPPPPPPRPPWICSSVVSCPAPVARKPNEWFRSPAVESFPVSAFPFSTRKRLWSRAKTNIELSGDQLRKSSPVAPPRPPPPPPPRPPRPPPSSRSSSGGIESARRGDRGGVEERLLGLRRREDEEERGAVPVLPVVPERVRLADEVWLDVRG